MRDQGGWGGHRDDERHDFLFCECAGKLRANMHWTLQALWQTFPRV